jgi:soluble lytic murein transglycosylase-like protein
MPKPEAHILAATVIDESGSISAALILAVIEIESKYSTKAKSKKGCKGLLQLSKGTAKTMAQRLGKNKFDIFDIKTNVMLGVNYLNALLEENGTILKALTVYNRGYKGFVKHGKKISGYALIVAKRSRTIGKLLKNNLTCEKY